MSTSAPTPPPAAAAAAAAAAPGETPITRRLANVSSILLILSGKGGVGKSSTTVQLALSLYAQGFRVGVLDTDLTGPSIPRMLGLDGQGVHQSTDGWVPVYADGPDQRLAVMSVAFLLRSSKDSVVWRGPKKEGMIKQFLGDVRWGQLDYLLIDTPPGTSDEHLSLLTHLHPLASRLSSIMVTTPQAVSLLDCSKSLDFTRQVSLPVAGLIENMSGYKCPCCAEVTYLFGQGGGEEMARREGIPFLGRVPVEAELVALLDSTAKAVQDGKVGVVGSNGAGGRKEFDLLERYGRTLSSVVFKGIGANVVKLLKGEAIEPATAETVAVPPPAAADAGEETAAPAPTAGA